jgi:hypothetical protein
MLTITPPILFKIVVYVVEALNILLYLKGSNCLDISELLYICYKKLTLIIVYQILNFILQDCCICCEKLNHASGYGEGQVENHVVYQLNKCSHMFHKLCLIAMYDSGSKVRLRKIRI